VSIEPFVLDLASTLSRSYDHSAGYRDRNMSCLQGNGQGHLYGAPRTRDRHTNSSSGRRYLVTLLVHRNSTLSTLFVPALSCQSLDYGSSYPRVGYHHDSYPVLVVRFVCTPPYSRWSQPIRSSFVMLYFCRTGRVSRSVETHLQFHSDYIKR